MLRKKSLKWYLFLLPALSILLVFITMFGVFNLAFEAYIQKESSKHIDAMFEKLDNYYRDTGYEGFYDENTEFIIQVYYAILDEDKQLLFPEQQWAESQEMERGRAAAASFAKHPQRADTKSGTKFKLGQESYYMKVRTYRGSYDSFFIGKEGDASYSVLVYINITPLQSFFGYGQSYSADSASACRSDFHPADFCYGGQGGRFLCKAESLYPAPGAEKGEEQAGKAFLCGV